MSLEYPGQVVVFECQDLTYLHLVRHHLESEGISVIVRDWQWLVHANWGASSFDQPRLEVAAGDAARSRELIEAFLEQDRTRSTATESDTLCESCGETCPGSFETCWSCGAPLSPGEGS